MLGEQEEDTYTALTIKQLESQLKLIVDDHKQERLLRRQPLGMKYSCTTLQVRCIRHFVGNLSDEIAERLLKLEDTELKVCVKETDYTGYTRFRLLEEDGHRVLDDRPAELTH